MQMLSEWPGGRVSTMDFNRIRVPKLQLFDNPGFFNSYLLLLQ